ncbi:hypothetical protein OEM_06490 [Mycobacterium intracellulare subsp. yongonense 05-1390]|nr:hypothetical protein OEM_06490 [Mycobacterium intracellulare subsp. yongonense 05-1390]ARR76319.1 Serine/threonine protein phosphatase [Mycobacterium intracellulare subsp. yongonense]ARR81471.1 hypothetical protein MOTT27_00650 [Mycobacterium intracellulare subsp. yongonense]
MGHRVRLTRGCPRLWDLQPRRRDRRGRLPRARRPGITPRAARQGSSGSGE